ncbi:MAG: endonuclease/exonuclease/phosphatase family protein [Gammaproteobacteria bacterium]|nr:endonuclease/exonuclease/phosphatase family protein [Gammaproteobacteria bacterium]
MPQIPPAAPLRLLSCNIQAGSSTRAYREYVTRSWSHVLHAGKRANLDSLAELFSPYDVVGLQESDPGSMRSGFDNQSDYLAERGQFPFVSHQSNRRISRIAGSGNAMLSRLEPTELLDYALPGRVAGRGVLLSRFGTGNLMGDFNCDPDAAEMRMLYKRTRLTPPALCLPTFPSWAPERALDHVLTAGFDVTNYRAMPAAGSDHLAVAVELTPQ